MAYDAPKPASTLDYMSRPVRFGDKEEAHAAAFARINAELEPLLGPPSPDRWLTGVTSFAGVSDSVAMANDARLRGERAS